MRVLGLTFVVAGLWGAQAMAACPPLTAAQRAQIAPAIITGLVESGPVTPARVRVEAWEKGRGPAVVEVDTGIYEDYALGEAVMLQPGERWRIYGELRGGRLLTGACEGSHRLAAPADAPALAIGSSRALAAPATFGGAALTRRPLPSLPAVTRRRLVLRFSAPVAAVRLLGAPRGAHLSGQGTRWRLRLPARALRGGWLVADTGDGFFAVRVRPRRPE